MVVGFSVHLSLAEDGLIPCVAIEKKKKGEGGGEEKRWGGPMLETTGNIDYCWRQ